MFSTLQSRIILHAKYKCRSLWPIFHGPVILPYILKTIWCVNTIIWDYESVWPKLWPKNKCKSLLPIFHGPVILPYILKTIWYMNTILWDYESVWPDVWPKNKCRSLWPIFHGPVILPKCRSLWPIFMVQWFCLISWRLFDVSTPYFGIMSQYDLIFDLKINVGHCDLYFMVQWFCLISWRLFDIWTPYFRIMSHYDPMFDLKINIGHCDLYFIVHWFWLIFLAHLSRRLTRWAYSIAIVRRPSVVVVVHTFKPVYLWSQLANLDQILCSITGVGERLHKVLGQIRSKLWFPWQQKAPIELQWEKRCLHLFSVVFDRIFFVLASNKDMHKISDEFEFPPDRTTDYGVSCPCASKKFPIDL